VECKALKPLFDNVEAQFGACLDSIKITGKVNADDMSSLLMGPGIDDEDYVLYIVSTTDTKETLAKNFLGAEDRAWMLMSLNKLEKLSAGDRIKIPRFISYEVKSNDSLPLISKRIFGDAKYADGIRQYNKDKQITEGETIQIPLYTIETPIVGETYSDLAKRHYADAKLAQRLLQYNNLQPVESLEKVKLPLFFKEQYYYYRVQSSDTLAWIARWLTGDSNNYRAIAEANNILYPYQLKVRQNLKIPASLVSDPSVFDKPIPRAKRPAKKPKRPKTDTKPSATRTPAPTPTVKPVPIDDPGLFDIE